MTLANTWVCIIQDYSLFPWYFMCSSSPTHGAPRGKAKLTKMKIRRLTDSAGSSWQLLAGKIEKMAVTAIHRALSTHWILIEYRGMCRSIYFTVNQKIMMLLKEKDTVHNIKTYPICTMCCHTSVPLGYLQKTLAVNTHSLFPLEWRVGWTRVGEQVMFR